MRHSYDYNWGITAAGQRRAIVAIMATVVMITTIYLICTTFNFLISEYHNSDVIDCDWDAIVVTVLMTAVLIGFSANTVLAARDYLVSE